MAKSKGKNVATPEKDLKVQTPTFKKKDKGLKAEKIKQAVAKTPPAAVVNASQQLSNKKKNQSTPAVRIFLNFPTEGIIPVHF